VKAPDVKVDVPKIDLSSLKKVFSDGLKEVVSAVEAIPKTEIPEAPDRWDEVIEWLQSIDTASRLIPEQPTEIKVKNPDGTLVGNTPYATRLDNTASPILYIGKAPVGSATSSAVWQIAKLDTTSGLVKTWADGNSNFDNVWDDILTITYS
ncbi:MAG: hypothetical protein KDH96_02095, partial [Candidatus Riesia sp.]|nr:hypothetical protein [Candidatus Riesia sp.]